MKPWLQDHEEIVRSTLSGIASCHFHVALPLTGIGIAVKNKLCYTCLQTFVSRTRLAVQRAEDMTATPFEEDNISVVPSDQGQAPGEPACCVCTSLHAHLPEQASLLLLAQLRSDI